MAIFHSYVKLPEGINGTYFAASHGTDDKAAARWRDGHIHRSKAFLLEPVHVICPGMAELNRPFCALVVVIEHNNNI